MTQYSTKSEVCINELKDANIFRVAEITTDSYGLMVRIHTEIREGSVSFNEIHDVFTWALIWEELEDLEYLSKVFRAERVDVFKQVVEMLGNLSRNKSAITELVA